VICISDRGGFEMKCTNCSFLLINMFISATAGFGLYTIYNFYYSQGFSIYMGMCFSSIVILLLINPFPKLKRQLKTKPKTKTKRGK